MGFQLRREPTSGTTLLYLLGGAVGGFAIGMLAGGVKQPLRALRRAGALVPDRLRRGGAELQAFAELEDRVLEVFLEDDVLRERGIDIGAISRGIVELTGSVRTREEIDRAVRLAGLVPGVTSVLNRLEALDEVQHYDETRRRLDEDDASLTEWAWTGRSSGMGRRRQSPETDPPRRDDAQWLRERALDRADRDQWQEEGLAARHPHLTERPDPEGASGRTRFQEHELDNQDPHGRHAAETRDRQPRDTNPRTRVGEGLKPGTELELEDSDVPLKPHSDGFEAGGEQRDGRTES
jgi:hypothetical protein